MYKFLKAAIFATTLSLTAIPVSAPASDLTDIEGFVRQARNLCVLPPATRCSNAIVDFLDFDDIPGVSIHELATMRTVAGAVAQDRAALLSDEERGILGLGLIALNSAKLENVFFNFDTNRDGFLMHDELFADFRLDNRSFSEVVQDRNAVDWERLADRFGKIGPALKGMIPQASGG